MQHISVAHQRDPPEWTGGGACLRLLDGLLPRQAPGSPQTLCTSDSASTDSQGNLKTANFNLVEVKFVMAVAGATLVLGSEILVEGAVQLGRNFSISEAIIGLTIVAIGTSAPELATSLAAARRGEHDLIVGNALGSNLFNLLAVLGLSALAWPLDLESSWKSWSTLHLPLSLAPLVLLVPLARTGRRLGRIEGLVLVVCWFAYIASLGHLDPSAAAMP